MISFTYLHRNIQTITIVFRYRLYIPGSHEIMGTAPNKFKEDRSIISYMCMIFTGGVPVLAVNFD